MLVKRFIIFSSIFILGIQFAIAQDSLIALPLKEVTVTENAFTDKMNGITIQRIDSLTLSQHSLESIAEVISSTTPINIKSYSPSGTATISLRGTSASHTGIYWNDIPLNSPTLGLSNLNLFPIAFAQSIDIQHGGSSALLGSGNIGGSIHLNSYPIFKKNISIGFAQEIGSFNNYASDLNCSIGKEKWYFATTAQMHKIKNDYAFINTADIDKPLLKQSNADMQQYGLMQAIYYKINNKQYIGSTIWYENNEAGVATLMTASKSIARQYDQSLRAITEWKNYSRIATYHIQCAYTNDISTYSDSSIHLTSIIRSQLYFIKGSSVFNLSKNDRLTTGLDLIENKADVAYYAQTQSREQMALFASYMHEFKKIAWKISLNARQEFISHYQVPFTPSIGLEGKIWKCLFIQSSASRIFRVPTLNDLFWVPGGNTNIVPESGWSEEGGLVIKNKNPSCNFITHTSIIAYSSIIENWIQWLPSDNNYWTAQNAKRVWARGIELLTSNVLLIKKIKFELNGGYTFSKSTNVASASENDQTIGKQLIYVPLQNANGEMRIIYKGSFISYNQNYVGKRYTTSDNLDSIPFYSLGNFGIGTKYQAKKFTFSILFKINNIWNVVYQSVEWMAMPGRNYNLVLKINFNKY